MKIVKCKNGNISIVLKEVEDVSDKEIKCLRMEDFHFIKIVNNKLLNKE